MRSVFGRQYRSLNRLEVSRAALISNYVHLSSKNSKIKVAPVLKSNAYGHGIVEVAQILDTLNPPFFCVDSLHEAYKLYKAKIRSRILVMGYIDPGNLRFKRLPFSYAVFGIKQLEAILQFQPEAGIHIFVDTGMGREGIPVDQLERVAKKIPEKTKEKIEGVMSHFAASEWPDDERTIKQVENFKRAIAILNMVGIHPRWRHIANSSGFLNGRKLGLNFTNMARCGIVSYGIDPEGKDRKLKMALRLITHIVQVKDIARGSPVGYNFTYTAKKDIVAAVLPLGYNDGVDRELSNKGTAIVNGVSCPIIGRVSMNITTIDISKAKGAKVGNEAEIKFILPNSSTIPYEFLVHLNPEIRRVIV